MKIACPNKECLSHISSPNVKRKGFYYRTSDRHHVQRWQCKTCFRNFSYATFHAYCWQKKRSINNILFALLGSNVTHNRCALLLKVNRKTVARRVPLLGAQARERQKKFQRGRNKVTKVQFDDLETFEQTKCKPVSVAMAVEEKSRIILGFSVSRMPAKGMLAEIARKKYGIRSDERPQGWDALFQKLPSLVDPAATFTSDSNPHYPAFVNKYFPEAKHVQVQGGRGSSGGQGELKRLKHDPIFTLNHTFAMFRANICRLIRRTWCTTKDIERLNDHISIYVDYHNRVLLKPKPARAHS
jgi:transposase-like protein